MKNMKISAKLILGFAIVSLIAALIGAVGIIGIKMIDSSYTTAYITQSKPIPDMAKVIEYLQRLRVNLRDFALYTGNAEQLQSVGATADSNTASFEKYADIYSETIVNKEARELFDDAMSKYNSTYKPLLNEVRKKAGEGLSSSELNAVIAGGTIITNEIVADFERCLQIKVEAAEQNSDDNTVLGNRMLTIMIAALVLGVIIAMILAVYISRLVSKPVILLDDMMANLVKSGDFHLSDADLEKVRAFGKYKDESGLMAHAFEELLTMMLAKCDTLETVADGDLTAEVEHISDKDTIGNAMQKMVDSLNKMFTEINSSSNQVSTGSVQIADGAQLLAQGATEQSATVEELSASVAEIAAQTKDNAGTAGEARDLAETIKVSAEQGSRQMEQMMQAVVEINESSKSIGKVIKIIDDIAFQTNILALNAAVEAARAGQHGKGFAVVADEVRSLAAKSAEAAKNTNELIESSIQKAEQGASISAETSESLKQIVEGILKSSELVSNIARSSNEQSIAISQIGEAIDQVSQVVQQNSATAEESAAASEEMSGQATLLQQLIAQFKIKNAAAGGYMASSSAAPAQVARISSTSHETGFSMGGADKY